MAITACIIQARLASTRLPAKVLLPLPTGRTVIEEVIYRCRRIDGVDIVVCAIPDTPDCDLLLPFCRDAHVARGPEKDVLARYALAAKDVKADIILRVTSDCPLLEPEICAKVLKLRAETGAGYASNTIQRTFPDGLDCEAFTNEALQTADREATDTYSREHVGPWILANSKTANLTAPVNQGHVRWTLDTLEDYVSICGLMSSGHKYFC